MSSVFKAVHMTLQHQINGELWLLFEIVLAPLMEASLVSLLAISFVVVPNECFIIYSTIS